MADKSVEGSSPAISDIEINDDKTKGTIRHEKVARVPTEIVDIDPALDRAITRKFDLHLLPWLFGIWLFAFIDRRCVKWDLLFEKHVANLP